MANGGEECIFCKLAQGEIPTQMIFENERIACFRDANPQAQTHVLIVPKKHYKDLADLMSSPEGREDYLAVGLAIPQIARLLGVTESGYRIINNCGPGAGQSVFHVHFHLVSDPKLQETLV